jgi:hypothetical protein
VTFDSLWLLLVALYVVDAITICEPGDVVMVGWRPGTARVRKGIDVWLGRPRIAACGRLVPPLDPPLIARGGRMDSKAAAERHARLVAEVRMLRGLTHALFVAMFVLLPGSLLAPYGWYRPLAVFGLIGACWIAVAVATLECRRRLWATDEGRPAVATTLLSPVSAIRALDAIATPVLASWHPVVVAHLLCGRQDYLALARTHCFAAASADATVLIAFLRSTGDWDDVEAPPVVESGCNAFCPSCHAQFRNGPETCPDCRVTLRRHAPATAAPASALASEVL